MSDEKQASLIEELIDDHGRAYLRVCANSEDEMIEKVSKYFVEKYKMTHQEALDMVDFCKIERYVRD